MTPRMMAAWLYFAEQRRNRERSEEVVLGFLGSQADWETIKKQREEWEKE